MPPADLARLWEEHTAHEFSTRDTESTLATMVEDAYVNHVPVLTGGAGKDALRAFYSVDFIPSMPPDTQLTPISRTVGEEQLVDEMIFSFTHTQEMPWMPAWHRADQSLRRSGAGRDRPLPRWQTRPRTHLLGPGVRAQADRITDRPCATGLRRRIRPQGARPVIQSAYSFAI